MGEGGDFRSTTGRIWLLAALEVGKMPGAPRVFINLSNNRVGRENLGCLRCYLFICFFFSIKIYYGGFGINVTAFISTDKYFTREKQHELA